MGWNGDVSWAHTGEHHKCWLIVGNRWAILCDSHPKRDTAEVKQGMEGQLDDVLQILWNASLTRQDMMLPSYDAEKGLKYLQVGCLCHLVIEPTLLLISPFEGICLFFFSPFSDIPKSHKYDYTILIVSPLSSHKHGGFWFTLIWTISHYPQKNDFDHNIS